MENEALKKHRFPKGYRSGNNNKKHPNGYLTPLLKRFLNKKIDITDPETQKKVKALVKDAVIWRLIFNATQGENEAIKEILNRIDGKVESENEKEGVKVIIVNGYRDLKEGDVEKQ